jgi:hypothetical protein
LCLLWERFGTYLIEPLCYKGEMFIGELLTCLQAVCGRSTSSGTAMMMLNHPELPSIWPTTKPTSYYWA